MLDTLNSDFVLYGMFKDNVDAELQQVLKFPALASLCVWMLTVGHDDNITIHSKHYGMADEFTPENFLPYLNECLNLFRIISEEDPDY